MASLRILIATGNPGKLREIRALLAPSDELPIDLYSLKDLGVNTPCPETGNSFLENATEKSLFYSGLAPDFLTISEDSGLVVEALGGRPGIHSARFAGPEATSDQNISQLLKEMRSKKNRRAAFVAMAALASEGNLIKTFEGRVEGLILKEREGERGFGYDPVFFYPPANRTFARLTTEEKNRVSHRARVFEKLRRFLMEFEF